MLGYEEWLKDKEATFKAENEITIDMLSKGISGLEWLVINTVVDGNKSESLHEFMNYLHQRSFIIKEIMADAIMMNADDFYKEHKINWYIAIEETLTYLNSLREQDYNKYLNFIHNLYLD